MSKKRKNVANNNNDSSKKIHIYVDVNGELETKNLPEIVIDFNMEANCFATRLMPGDECGNSKRQINVYLKKFHDEINVYVAKYMQDHPVNGLKFSMSEPMFRVIAELVQSLGVYNSYLKDSKICYESICEYIQSELRIYGHLTQLKYYQEKIYQLSEMIEKLKLSKKSSYAKEVTSKIDELISYFKKEFYLVCPKDIPSLKAAILKAIFDVMADHANEFEYLLDGLTIINTDSEND